MTKPPKKVHIPDSRKPTPIIESESDHTTAQRYPDNHVNRSLPAPGPSSALQMHDPSQVASHSSSVRVFEMADQAPGVDKGSDVPKMTIQMPAPLLPEQLAMLANEPYSPEGLRYDQRARPYADLQEGTFLVRKDGRKSYKISSINTTYGLPIERIQLTNLWKKRDASTTRPETQLKTVSVTRPDWENWGKDTLPQEADSIEIEGRHFVIVPQKRNSYTSFAYLKHPDFSPGSYEAFEQMLGSNLDLQPRRAERFRLRWSVVEPLAYRKKLVETVTECFSYLSDQTSTNIARAVFDRANNFAPVMQGEGLAVLHDTLKVWLTKSVSRSARRDLADPLVMLPELPARWSADLTQRSMSLPSPHSTALLRIDYDLRKVENELYELDSPEFSLRGMFADILEDNGYQVDRDNRLFSEDALLFRRAKVDAVFILKLPSHNESAHLERPLEPGAELRDPALSVHIENSQWRHMLVPGKAVHLVGGVQRVEPDQRILFIVREG
ncbi:hypothetical protein FGA82_26210 [Pseudomonas fluorescens]|uniref:hypothetical protein n=1 Tax=Pseudomonas fluorescens TaxID=294 RepID=UPI00113196A1|nr:hypothetical protein [Pseudomonas fluorescens]TMU71562.1 hypothetical protein FGA82_26210 [Pseudomonas fluorescens]